MSRFIIHHEGLFFEWSTVVDAPVTCAMTRSEFESYWREQHGVVGLSELSPRLDRAIKRGCSAFDGMTAKDCIAINRAGANGRKASFKAVIAGVLAERPAFGLPLLP